MGRAIVQVRMPRLFPFLSIVLIALTSAAACGGASTTAEQTRTAPAGSPMAAYSPGATAAVTEAAPLSEPGSLAEATASWVTPVAAGSAGARADCPEGWATFIGAAGQLSACGPTDIDVTTDVNERGEPGFILGTRSTNGVPEPGLPRFAVGARLASHPSLDLDIAAQTNCAMLGKDGEPAEIVLGNREARGCASTLEGDSPDGPLRSMMLVAGIGEQQYLNITVNWRTRSAGAQDIALQMAASLWVVRGG